MEEWGLVAGDEVELRGLSKVELNGTRGTVLPVEYPEQAKAMGRLPIMMESGKQLSIKVENIVKVTQQAQRSGGDRGESWVAELGEKRLAIGLPLKGEHLAKEPLASGIRERRPGLSELPAVGFGTCFMPEDLKERVPDKEYRQRVEDLTEEAVQAALEAGVRLFDCSNSHINQQTVGRVLQEAISDGTVVRTELFVTGRIWRCRDRGEVRREVDKMLRELQVEYVDLLMAEIPPDRAPQTWGWLEEVYREGRARYLGVSNFDLLGPKVCVEAFRKFLAGTAIPPAVHCMEVHPFNTNEEMSECCRGVDVQVMAASPLGAPHKIEAFLKFHTKSDARDMRPLLKVPESPGLQSIGKRHGVSAAQVALRWNLQRGHCVIPKSFRSEHVEENVELFDFHLSSEEMATITALHKGVRAERFFQQAHSNNSKAMPKMTRDAQDECDEILRTFRGGAKTEEAKMRAQIAEMMEKQRARGGPNAAKLPPHAQ